MPMDDKASTPQGETGSKISCKVRCADPKTVETAMARLDPEGTVRVPYTCQISGKQEKILLLGSRLAARLAEAMPEAGNAAGARILAGLYDAELCECDVATLTRLPDDDAADRLRAFEADGLLAHRVLHGMHYFRLASGRIRREIREFIP
jgi:hypothetical protein